jgi:predicted ABC-type ATPase
MKHILPYIEFITEEENSSNPIPELEYDGKLGIILLGLPGAGKSTFAKNHIKADIKKFSTDDVSLEFTGDPKKHYPDASRINMGRLISSINRGEDFIYDTTGINEENVKKVYEESKSSGYKVIFILVLIDKGTAKMQNIRRSKIGGHMADEWFIEDVYKEQLRTTKQYLKLKPDGFYIAHSKSYYAPIHEFPQVKYQFMKFDKSGVLMRRRRNNYEYK